MRERAVILLLLAASLAAGETGAQPQNIPGMIALRETELLTYEDKLAAFDAEQAVLAERWLNTGFDWQGPNGAYGTIIAGTTTQERKGGAECRRFVHIVHHKNDGGANPTFQGTICRGESGQWAPR